MRLEIAAASREREPEQAIGNEEQAKEGKEAVQEAPFRGRKTPPKPANF